MLYTEQVYSSMNVNNNYWIQIVTFFIVFSLCSVTVYLKNKSIKEWLVWACSVAEKTLGSGTGRLKLRQVYDYFVTKYPIVSTFISFELFGDWVDKALIEMKNMIDTNAIIKEYIEGGND